MSKWNKQNCQPLSQEFIQNEERRKQMIIEAAKRRKDKEKKIQEQEQTKRKAEEEALLKHKLQKKENYVKYLKGNIHDKYEQAKKKKKEQIPEIKPMAKWKKKSAQKQQKNPHQEQQQNQQPPLQNKTIIQSNSKLVQQMKNNSSRKKIKQEFDRQWQFQNEQKDELLSSKLLDSLDLDIGTIKRQKEMKLIMKENPKNNDIKQLRDLIGYESTVFNKNHQISPEKKVQPKVQVKIEDKKKVKKNEMNQIEMMNELKNKQEAKMLKWAIIEQQEAEDLFSQCSEVKKQKSSKALKEVNEDIKNKKVQPIKKLSQLQTIKQMEKQKNFNKSKEKLVPRETKVQNNASKPIVREKSVQNNNKKQVQKKSNITQPNFKKNNEQKHPNKTSTALNYNHEKVAQKARSTSQEKSRQIVSKEKRPQMVKPQKKEVIKYTSKPELKPKVFGNLPPLPVSKFQNNSIATHDMQIDLQSYIKQDLVDLNQQERKIQQQLKNIHKNNKQKVKQIYSKYEIKNDYKYSGQVLGEQTKQKPYKYYQNEAQIQDSIENLDNYLIRRELQSKDRNRIIHEQAEEESSKSYINPFSNSDDLCNQVLQLAKNISRFEKKQNNDENTTGYRYMNKMKRNNSGNKLTDGNKVSKNNSKNKPQEDTQMLSESRDVSQISQQPLCRPPFIFQASQIRSKMYEHDEDKYQKPEKIHVNKHLLKGLLQDDQ